jgi:hypothetical protein
MAEKLNSWVINNSSCVLVEKIAVEKTNIVDIVGDNAKYKQST